MAEPLDIISLRELLGDSAYLTYLRKVFAPNLRRLHTEGKVDPFELDKIQTAMARSPFSIDIKVGVHNEITLNSAEPDGGLYDMTFSVGGEEMRHVIKQSSGKEDFSRAVRNQRAVYEWLKGTDLEGAVPNPEFTNRARRIMVAPTVDAEPLKDVLVGLGDPEKESKIQGVIDDYVSLFRKINTERSQKRLRKPKSMRPWMASSSMPPASVRGGDTMKNLWRKDKKSESGRS